MTQTYCGLPLIPLTGYITQNHNTVFWNSVDNYASSIQFSVDTHYMDLSNYPIRVEVSVDIDTIHSVTNGTVPHYIDRSDESMMAFQSEEDLNMTILKYPELFTDMIIYN